MPKYVYTDVITRSYTETRDSSGVIIGTVIEGAIRDLPEAPDQFWTPAGRTGSTARTSKPAGLPETDTPPDTSQKKGA